MKKFMFLLVIASFFTACSKDDEILTNLDKLNQTGFTEVSIYFDSSIKSCVNSWSVEYNVLGVSNPIAEDYWGDYVAYTIVGEIDLSIPLKVLLPTGKLAEISNGTPNGNSRAEEGKFTPQGKAQVYRCYYINESINNQYLSMKLISQQN